MHLSLLIPLTGAAMNALCIFIIRLLDKDFIEAYKKTLKSVYILWNLCYYVGVAKVRNIPERVLKYWRS